MKHAPKYEQAMPAWLESSILPLQKAALSEGLSKAPIEIARFAGRMEALCQQSQNIDDPLKKGAVTLAAFFCALALERGDTCIKLSAEDIKRILPEAGTEIIQKAFPDFQNFPELAKLLLSTIKKSSIIGIPGTNKPFVLDKDNLYMHRYWSYEQNLAKMLKELSEKRAAFLEGHDLSKAVKAGLYIADTIFGYSETKEPDWQKTAAVMSLFNRLVVVTGGPGTGKTWTVTGLMAVLLSAAEKIGIPFQISLCAPTGKAAARINESVSRAISSMKIPENIKSLIPLEATTIHRLLGASIMPGRFHYHADNPLSSDVIIVDEASMVDLPLMVHLLNAMKDGCSLVLIGDKNQLPSVETGSVLADICAGLNREKESQEFAKAAEIISFKNENRAEKLAQIMCTRSSNTNQSLRDCVVKLTKTHRFGKKSGISELAQAINNGAYSKAQLVLNSHEFPDVQFIDAAKISLEELVREKSKAFLSKLYSQTNPSKALAILDTFKILCGIRQGIVGIENLNRIMSLLALEKLSHVSGLLFKGMPIVINKNDYQADLYNGDTGICWPDEDNHIKVWFPDRNKEEPRKFSLGRLPNMETAWALTIHRSQGSEFDTVFIVLPPASSHLSGRELLYTAVTRAKKQVIIYGTTQDLKSSISNRTHRNSGLRKILWK